ncbi:MAG: exosortase-associated EpsI family protein [Fimbriimonadales bacterium]
MQKRLKIVLVLFALVGIAAIAIQPKIYLKKEESWMETSIPEEVPGYLLAGSTKSNPMMKMDENTYQILDPFGIVVRAYTGPADGKSYEFTVIAGNSRKSFHDPQICFSAQQWQLIDPGKREVSIPSLGGRIPATVMAIDKPGARGIAMYFYGGPGGWRHSPLALPVDLTLARLMLKDDIDAQFFRFIMQPATTPASNSAADVEKAMKQDLDALSTFAEACFAELNKQPDGKYYTQH